MKKDIRYQIDNNYFRYKTILAVMLICIFLASAIIAMAITTTSTTSLRYFATGNFKFIFKKSGTQFAGGIFNFSGGPSGDQGSALTGKTKTYNVSVSGASGGFVTNGGSSISTRDTVTIPENYIGAGTTSTNDNRIYYHNWFKFTQPKGYKYSGNTADIPPASFSLCYRALQSACSSAPAADTTRWLYWAANMYTVGTRAYSNSTRYTNASVTFNFVPNTTAVTFNKNGGEGSMSDQTLTYDSTTNLNANTYTKERYTFKGWNTKADGTGTHYEDKAYIKNQFPSATSLNLYAEWEGNKGTIRFDANGGDGIMDDQEYVYAVTDRIKENEFKNRGYTFAGWNTKRDGSGESYADRENILTTFEIENGDVIKLYAQWKKKEKGTFSLEGDTEVTGYEFLRAVPREDTVKITASLSDGQFYSIFGINEEAKFKITEQGTSKYIPKFEITKGAGYAEEKHGEGEEGESLSTACESIIENMTYSFTNTKQKENTNSIKVIKKVTGDLITPGDKEREFLFSYDITGIDPDGEYSFKKSSENGVIEEQLEADTVLSPGNSGYEKSGRISGEERIRHDEFFIIDGLPNGAKYNVTEIADVSQLSSWPYRSSYEVTDGNDLVESVTSFGMAELPAESDIPYGLSVNQKGVHNDKGLGMETVKGDIEYTFRNSKAEKHNITLKKQVDIDGEENVIPPENEEFTVNMHFSDLNPETEYSSSDPEYSFSSDENGKADVKIKLRAKAQVTFYNIPGDAEYEVSEEGCAYTAGLKIETSSGKIYGASGMYGQGISVSNQEERITESEDEEIIGLDDDQTILFTNSKKISNDLAVNKKTYGKGVKESDEFSYSIDFSDIMIKDYAVIKETKNEDDEIISSASSVYHPSGVTDTYSFTLKNNQTLRMKDLPDSVKYKITEAASEGYTPTYDYETDIPGEDDESVSGEAEEGASLSTKVTPLVVDSEITFTNIKDTPPPRKTVSDTDDLTWEGTGPETDVKENTVPSRTHNWEYKISQKIYPGYESFELSDELPANIVFKSFPLLSPSSDISIRWIKENGSVITENISNHFKIEQDHDSLHVQSTDPQLIEAGGTFEIRLNAKVNPNSDMKDFKAADQVYRKNERLIFTNEAETILDENSFRSNTVRTNIPLGLILTISKNVKGDLGDLTKEFRFTADFTGLEAGKTYSYNNGRQSFRADSGGRASVSFKLRDDGYLPFESLPYGAGYVITEAASNHISSYEVIRGSGSVNRRSDALTEKERSLSTPGETLTESREYRFTNIRELEPVTGAGMIQLALIMAFTAICIAGMAFRKRMMWDKTFEMMIRRR